jgi:hypothetical protein
MQATLTTQSDALIKLCAEFYLVNENHVEEFLILVPRWYEAVIEHLATSAEPLLVLEDYVEWLHSFSESEELWDFMNENAYDNMERHPEFGPREKWTEEQEEMADEELSTHHHQIQGWLVKDIGLALDFLHMSYAEEYYIGGGYSQVGKHVVNNAIVEVW